MAQKYDGRAAAHPPAPPAHVSPPVTPSDKLLFSLLSLPPNSRVAYVTFAAAADGPPYDLLEAGRRQLLSRNDSVTLLDSILPHVHIDSATSALHAFKFTSYDHADACLSALRAISLDGLVGRYYPDPSQLAFLDPYLSVPRNSQCSQFRIFHSSIPKVYTLVHSNAQPSRPHVTSAVTQNALQPVILISQQPTSFHASLSV